VVRHARHPVPHHVLDPCRTPHKPALAAGCEVCARCVRLCALFVLKCWGWDRGWAVELGKGGGWGRA
jgi:hypothetical protein